MNFFRQLFLTRRLGLIILAVVVLLLAGFSFPLLFSLGRLAFFLLAVLFLVDILILYAKKNGIGGERILPEKLSNGDQNEVFLQLASRYSFRTSLRIIDELPAQLQVRDLVLRLDLLPGQSKKITYQVRPVKRGNYSFGKVNIFTSSPLGLVERRFTTGQDQTARVYPSFIQMRHYELLAVTYKLQDQGIKKLRKLGQNREFEQIKDYIAGDDIRSINWKATARSNKLMVNVYQDEKSQQVYSLINKGRVMRMPFNGMTLLDYSINAALAISNIAMLKDDKPGLVTFQHKVATVLPASKRSAQMRLFMETLYHEKTAYKETDYSSLYSLVKSRISKRSLLIMYTNFESVESMRQQKPYLQKMAGSHLVLCIIFLNTELDQILESRAEDMDEIFTRTIAEKLAYEKKQIAKELNQAGIQTLLTKPENLTISTINKYLEIKARGLI